MMFTAMHSCGDVSLWRKESNAPRVNEYLTCFTCGEYVKVVKIVGPWRVKCLTRGCGLDETLILQKTAQQHVTRHLQHWSTHRVRFWQYGITASVQVITSAETGIQPQLLSDAPF